tara:strand:+ start:15657 stop:17531 length:1875 start_codon:yes stop_codon:yes gene_type:complete
MNLKRFGIGILGMIVLLGAIYFFMPSSDAIPFADENTAVSKINAFVVEDNAGCFSCHGQMSDMVNAHAQSGCISCHKGNGTARTVEAAHENMVHVPGNFADMNTTCGACHAESVAHIETSIMATNSGLINVDRYIFGERLTPDGYAHITDIGQTAADNHLRMLCARCHLGKEKWNPEPVSELSRGGGCVACHLNYSEKALNSHHKLAKGETGDSPHHPTLDVQIGNEHCFGCHSRSGRISTNYEGWHETMFRVGDSLPKDSVFREMEDGRVFTKMEEDVHHALGLQCIDCHLYAGMMGDGTEYEHEEDAVKISCEDCHFDGAPNSVEKSELTSREKRIYGYRNYSQTKMLRTRKDCLAITNSRIDTVGKSFLMSKFTDAEFQLTSPSQFCSRAAGHKDITCSACHSAWAPQCAGCHVDFDATASGYDLLEDKHVSGTWVESAGGFFAEMPTLGVYRNPGKKSITAAVPGMIMTLDLSNYPGKSAGDTTWHRLFAPSKPHTVAKKGRNCVSCHNDPLAIGYGRGTLTFVTDEGQPHWEFESEYGNSPQDGLPMDAWIPFLGTRTEGVSTRLNYTPFTVTEQQKILTVGACLTCHTGESELMKKSLLVDFKTILEALTADCKLPVF